MLSYSVEDRLSKTINLQAYHIQFRCLMSEYVIGRFHGITIVNKNGRDGNTVYPRYGRTCNSK